jgi:hypothetical protein
MPKQIGDLTKFERISKIMEMMNELGRANPQQIFEKLLSFATPETNTENLKRTVYRDLKELATSGKVGIAYIAPDGRRLEDEPEDGEIKNFRIEYFLGNPTEKLLGYELLQSHGGAFYFKSTSQIRWKIADRAPEKKLSQRSKAKGLIFEASVGEFLTLSASHEDLPFKVLLARRPDSPESEADAISWAQKEFGNRLGVLLLKERHLSRLGSTRDNNSKRGHALIEFAGDGGFKVYDLSSTSGTFWTRMTAEAESFISRRTVANRAVSTFIPSESSIFESVGWNEIKGEAKFENSSVLRVGNVLVSIF